MVMTASTMLPVGTRLPYFQLRDPDGTLYSTSFCADKPLLLIFMCNHCPFVQHIREELVRLTGEYLDRGVAVLGINANINPDFPEDSPAKMKEYARRYSYPFPYLVDDDQSVARLFQAACTPDFYLFDREHLLAYRGQLDDSRPSNNLPVTGRDLRAALDAVLAGKPAPAEQKPSLGCNIKWRPGNEPDYLD